MKIKSVIKGLQQSHFAPADHVQQFENYFMILINVINENDC